MKRIVVFCLLALVSLIWNASTATARPQYKKEFDAVYKESQIADAAKAAKCNNCHYGKTKKNRNDYGTALSKHLSKVLYKKLKGDKPALAKKVREALKAVLDKESSGGETFGARIEAGKLPGTAPAE